MITLQFRATKPNRFPLKIGEVLHLKVVEVQENGYGYLEGLVVDDVTPLPGAEPDGYGCHMCGIIEEAKPDGGLPDGWTERKFEDGSFFICSNKICQEQPNCKICGCTNEQACEGGCHWVEVNLCSACAGTRASTCS